MEANDKQYLCPVCGKYHFEEFDDYDICPICNWENDGIQNDDPDYEGGANTLSLNQFREAYKKGISLKSYDEVMAYRKILRGNRL